MDLNDKKIPKYRTPFRPAVEGLFATIRQERNFRFHLLAAFCACLLGFFFSLSKTEWIAILISIFGVIAMELMNTAIERAVDLTVGQKYHPLAKLAKDAAAAAVLMWAVLAAIVGCIVFLPKLWHVFQGAAF